MQTPDGTILESCHRHDCVFHEDKNGKVYMIDGGHDYIRHTSYGDEKFISIYNTDDIEIIRECMKWGRNYDENMRRLPETQWILLKDLNDGHLDALIQYDKIPDWRRILFLEEKQFRMLTQENL
jgi:hypothetical protein